MSNRNAKSIFLEAVEHYPQEQWDTFLDSACSHVETRVRVKELLKAHLKGYALLDKLENHAVERVGMTVGRYTLRKVIGEGGFGVAWTSNGESARLTRGA